jgi:hypothetical protein
MGFNNNYAGRALGPAYLGLIGGIVALRDGSALPSGGPAVSVDPSSHGRIH